MKIAVAAMAAGLLLLGCTTRETKPSEAEMNRAESAILAQSCINDFSGWHRIYYYHPRYFGEEVEDAAREQRLPRASGHVRTLIGFDLRPSASGVEDRESLLLPPAEPQDQEIESVGRVIGNFDLRDGRLDLRICEEKGPNQ